MGKSIGETLKEGRMHQHLSISECAKRTHITGRYLEALEEERWVDFPSESHRMGFLRLYARFLGVYTEDLMQVYHQSQQPAPVEKPVDVPRRARSVTHRSMTLQWMIFVLVLALVSLWGLYHTVRRYYPDQHMDLSWLRFRPDRAPRLVTPRREVAVQRLRAKADADSWLRIMDNHQLVFEGILPAGAVKEWSGPGPFRIKVGNSNAISIYWNDQPVDIKAATQGNVAEIRLPPAVEPEKS